MDNAGDWLYIVFLIIAGISSLFGSKNKKKRPKQILGQPDREIVTNEDNVPDKGFWEILEEMQNPKPALSYGISGSGGFARGVRGFAFRFLFSGDRFTFLQLFLLRHRPELQVKLREDTDKERGNKRAFSDTDESAREDERDEAGEEHERPVVKHLHGAERT